MIEHKTSRGLYIANITTNSLAILAAGTLVTTLYRLKEKMEETHAEYLENLEIQKEMQEDVDRLRAEILVIKNKPTKVDHYASLLSQLESDNKETREAIHADIDRFNATKADSEQTMRAEMSSLEGIMDEKKKSILKDLSLKLTEHEMTVSNLVERAHHLISAKEKDYNRLLVHESAESIKQLKSLHDNTFKEIKNVVDKMRVEMLAKVHDKEPL